MDGNAILAGMLAGAGLGGALGWLLGAARTRAAGEPALRDAEGRARAAAATLDEVRRSEADWKAHAGGLEQDLRRSERDRVAALVKAQELERGLQSERQSLDETKAQMEFTFQALAAEALQRSNEGFLQLATEKLAGAQREGKTELAAREEAIAALVTPLRQALDKVEQQAHA
ncbi:MAG TPA: hypothetical protein VHU40_01115, partial [Polyangia bacterium]|nr:hypothetical protein [Polyangia bacterium]